MPVGLCLLAAALFGASTPASKRLLDGVEPLVLAGLLYLGAALGVLPFCFRGGSPRRWRDPWDVLGGLVALTGMAIIVLGHRSSG